MVYYDSRGIKGFVVFRKMFLKILIIVLWLKFFEMVKKVEELS